MARKKLAEEICIKVCENVIHKMKSGQKPNIEQEFSIQWAKRQKKFSYTKPLSRIWNSTHEMIKDAMKTLDNMRSNKLL